MKMIRFRIRWYHFFFLAPCCSTNRAAQVVVTRRFFCLGLLLGLCDGDAPPPPPRPSAVSSSTSPSSSSGSEPGLDGGSSAVAGLVPRPRLRLRCRRDGGLEPGDEPPGDEPGDERAMPAAIELDRPRGGGETGRPEPPGECLVTVKTPPSAASIATSVSHAACVEIPRGRITGFCRNATICMYLFPLKLVLAFRDFREEFVAV